MDRLQVKNQHSDIKQTVNAAHGEQASRTDSATQGEQASRTDSATHGEQASRTDSAAQGEQAYAIRDAHALEGTEHFLVFLGSNIVTEI